MGALEEEKFLSCILFGLVGRWKWNFLSEHWYATNSFLPCSLQFLFWCCIAWNHCRMQIVHGFCGFDLNCLYLSLSIWSFRVLFYCVQLSCFYNILKFYRLQIWGGLELNFILHFVVIFQWHASMSIKLAVIHCSVDPSLGFSI